MRRIVLFSLTLLVGVVAIRLGFWQLARHRQRAEHNRDALAGRALPAIQIQTGAALTAERRAVVSGSLDESHQFVLRNRLVRGVPAVMVVTPLRIAGSDTALLINRGYVPAPDAIDPGDAEFAENADDAEKTFAGVLLAVPDRGDGQPLTRNGKETWKALDLRAMRERVPYPLAGVYLLVEPDSGSRDHTVEGTVYPFRAEPPPMTSGPHLSYAIQWFGIAMAVVAFGFFFILRKRPRTTEN